VRLRFQADANLDARLVRGLKRIAPEIDIQSASEAALSALSDPAVLGVAATEGRILITQDRKTMPRHFQEFVRETESPVLILLRGGISIGSAIEELVLIWHTSKPEEWVNRVIWIPL